MSRCALDRPDREAAAAPTATLIRPRRVVLLGLGAINTRVMQLLCQRESAIVIVGVVVRHPRNQPHDSSGNIRWISSPDELSELAPDLILEAASREAVREWGESALRACRRVVLSSASALADDELRHRLKAVARECGSRLVLSPGALAGTEALAAASRLPLEEVVHRIVKSPERWGSAQSGQPQAVHRASAPVVLFRGSAREASTRYPLNANVAVVSALCGVGLDDTVLELVSDPGATRNRHEILASGDFGSLRVVMENQPLATNPKSSEQAALALVRLAENEVADIVV